MQFFFEPGELGISLADDFVQLFDQVVLFLVFPFPLIGEEGRQPLLGQSLPLADLGGMDLVYRADLADRLVAFQGGEGDRGLLMRGELLFHRRMVRLGFKTSPYTLSASSILVRISQTIIGYASETSHAGGN